MSSDSEIPLNLSPLEAPVESKLKRRSSLFRPNKTGSYRYCDDNDFPPDYTAKLVQENIKWQEAYNVAKSEYLELKKKMEHKALELQSTINFRDYEAYLENAKNFLQNVDVLVVLHETTKKCLNNQIRQLSKEIEVTSKKIYKKLDIHQPGMQEPLVTSNN